MSDCWTANKALYVDKDYEHKTVNHSYNFIDPDGSNPQSDDEMYVT